jgi:hypothetical protein
MGGTPRGADFLSAIYKQTHFSPPPAAEHVFKSNRSSCTAAMTMTICHYLQLQIRFHVVGNIWAVATNCHLRRRTRSVNRAEPRIVLPQPSAVDRTKMRYLCNCKTFVLVGNHLCSLTLLLADASGMLPSSRTQVLDDPAAPPLDLASPLAKACSRSDRGCKKTLPPASPNKRCDACSAIHRDEEADRRRRKVRCCQLLIHHHLIVLIGLDDLVRCCQLLFHNHRLC